MRIRVRNTLSGMTAEIYDMFKFRGVFKTERLFAGSKHGVGLLEFRPRGVFGNGPGLLIKRPGKFHQLFRITISQPSEPWGSQMYS